MSKDQSDKRFWEFPHMMAYLKGELPAEEVAALESYMASNPAYAEELEQLHDEWLQNPHLEEELQHFRQFFLQKMNDQATTEQPKSKGMNLRVLRPVLAAAAVIALLLTFWFAFPFGKSDSCGLQDYACLAQAEGLYAHRATLKGDKQDAFGINKAFQLYEQADFAKAIPELKAVVRQKDVAIPIKQEAEICMAYSYLMIGQTDQAFSKAEVLKRSKDQRVRPEGLWIQALLHLAQAEEEEQEKARIALEELSKTNNPYSAKAKELLDRLNQAS
ncbi:MAG: hypothetical protein MRY78_04535 [Saprospiraceae bacterium]|nr:hypothetical protein [Saprospiraceae bacterium]